MGGSTARTAASAHTARTHVGNRLKQKRQAAGLSLRALAALTHIHFSTLQRLEAGIYDLSVERLLLLTNALGCDHRELLDEIKTHAEQLEEPTHA